MDPLSALSVAAAVVQFVDFTSNVISEALEIKQSTLGTTVENSEIEIVASSINELTKNLDDKLVKLNKQRKLSGNEVAVKGLGVACRDVSQDLQNAIKDLKNVPLEMKFLGKESSWASFRQALKSVWRKGEIESLEKRLDRLRQQLNTSLLLTLQDAMNSAPSAKAQVMGRASFMEAEERKQWQTDLIEAAYENNWKAENEDHVLQSAALVSNLVGADRIAFLTKKFLHQLSFHSMSDRQEGIAEAYKQTFEWIFQSQSPGDARWDPFLDWICRDSPIYWITGKAGSGKPTLMKFIYRDPRTTEFLKVWADGSQVILSAFHFWNSGVKLQMSQLGLLRSLLHDTLIQCPEVISNVFPERWESYITFGGDVRPWTIKELREAFQILVKDSKPLAKFCFLIDGLDEFDGEHEELIEWLREDLLLPRVKVCVSSRPWLVFEDAFCRDPSLKLQDLTYQDITHYITSEFLKSSTVTELNKREPEYISELINEVANKASGVFLWVRLVVRSLLKGITNGDRISDIKRRLDNLPADLEDLFSKMLDSIDPFYLEHASQMFQLVRAAVCPLSVLTLSFADEEDPDIAFRLPIQPLSKRDIDTRVEAIRRRISRCKGLIEAIPNAQLNYLSDESLVIAEGLEVLLDEDEPENSNSIEGSNKDGRLDIYSLANFKVEYLHRTVKDYLTKPEVWNGITDVTASTPFDAHHALCRSFVMLLKTLNPHSLTRSEFWHVVWMIFEHAACVEASTGQAPIALLDELDRAATNLSTRTRPSSITFLQAHAAGVSGRNAHWTMTRQSRTGFNAPSSGILSLAIQCGLHSYVKSKVDEKGKLKCTTATATVGAKPLLHLAVSNDKELPSVMGDSMISRAIPSYSVATTLLDLGENPNSLWRGTTPWKQLLMQIAENSNSINSTYPNYQRWISVVELFIQNGGDPNVDFDNLTGYKLQNKDPEKYKQIKNILRQRRSKGRRRISNFQF